LSSKLAGLRWNQDDITNERKIPQQRLTQLGAVDRLISDFMTHSISDRKTGSQTRRRLDDSIGRGRVSRARRDITGKPQFPFLRLNLVLGNCTFG
jgi:hypothetical protein